MAHTWWVLCACQVWVSTLFFVRSVWHAIAQMQLLIASFVHIIFCSLWIHLFSFLLSRTSSKILPWSSNLIPISEVFIFLKCILSSSCLLITMMFSFYRCSSFFMNYGEVFILTLFSALWNIISAPCCIIYFLYSFLPCFSV